MNKTSESRRKKTVLITGAASGIGYQLTQIFARHSYNLVLVDKNEQKLTEIIDEFPQKFGVFVKILVKDLSISTSPKEIFTELQQASIKIDVLVNNAGFGTYGAFTETDLGIELRMLQVNMVSLTHLTKLFLKDMIEQDYGKILNVASAAAFQPGPLMAVYFATKAYVLSFSEAIANELEAQVSALLFFVRGQQHQNFNKLLQWKILRLLALTEMMDTETVAKIGYRGLMKNKTVVVPGMRNKIID